jgi:inorganic pyrophosphatase
MGLHNVPFGEVEAFNVVIEISMGSQDKYEYDEKLDVIKLDRVLYSSYRFPANYGFVPETRAEDGDHTDVVLLSTNPLMAGTVAEARAIGFMEMVDSGEVDNKIIAVPTKDPRFSDIKTLEDLPEHRIKEIKNFFETYKILQNKTVEIKGFQGVDRAKEELVKTREVYGAEMTKS